MSFNAPIAAVADSIRVIIAETVVDEGAKIVKGSSEADISVCDMEVRCFREFVICVVVAFCLPLRPTLIVCSV